MNITLAMRASVRRVFPWAGGPLLAVGAGKIHAPGVLGVAVADTDPSDVHQDATCDYPPETSRAVEDIRTARISPHR